MPRLPLALAALVAGGLTLAACDGTDPADASATLGGPTAESAGIPDAACDRRANNTFDKLLECVRLDGVRAHQAALQQIADAHGGTRASGTPGFDASADYVVQALEAAGWTVTRQPFTFPATTAVLEQVAPIAAVYATTAFTGSAEGDVTADVTPVDLNLGGDRFNTSGCEAADFAGFPAGNIALIQRGSCTFAIKAQNAEAAGAAGVIIFNQGNTPGREGPFGGTLSGAVVNVPVVSAAFAAGFDLSQPATVARVMVDDFDAATENVVAEKAGQPGAPVVMLGAHLDSAPTSPGSNDNASGAAALLEIAEALAHTRTPNTLRFAWWGAYEPGIIGSQFYVDGLSPDEIDALALYVDAHMLGSPNYVRFVYDGSPDVTAFFQGFYDARGLASSIFNTFGRSDAGPFALAGVPTGGLFGGAEGLKTAEEAATYGGTAGQPYDPCFHQACDTFDNVNLAALDLHADALAAAALHFATDGRAPRGGPAPAAPLAVAAER